MDNVKYMNTTLAYDFEMFMPKVKEAPVNNVIKMPKTQKVDKKRKGHAVNAVSSKVWFVCAIIFLLAAFCGNIYMHIAINETNAQIKAIETEINELDSEYTKLSVDFNRIISYQNLEEEAQKLGMRKMDKSQVVYIRVNDANVARDSSGAYIQEE